MGLDSIWIIMMGRFSVGIMLLVTSMTVVCCRLWGVDMGLENLRMQGRGVEEAVINSGLVMHCEMFLVVRSKFAEKASVPSGCLVGAVHSYEVAVVWEDLQHLS